MSPPTPMTREELIELASLDALGLLDEYESALFTRSFHHAPAAVQKEIKDLQAAVTADPSLLPEVEPRSELRQVVVSSVAGAVEAESEELAPLAMIGRGQRTAPARSTRGVLGASGQFYRAAAFVLAGVLLVVLYFGSQRSQKNDAIKELAIGLLAEQQVAELLQREVDEDLVGPDLAEFIDQTNTQEFVLSGANGKKVAVAIVYVNEHSDEAFLFTIGLPENQDLEFTARDETGAVVPSITTSFRTAAVIGGIQLGKIPSTLATTLTFEISVVGESTVLASTAS